MDRTCSGTSHDWIEIWGIWGPGRDLELRLLKHFLNVFFAMVHGPPLQSGKAGAMWGCSSVQEGGNFHISTRAQGFPVEHLIVMRCSMLSSPVSGFNAVADRCSATPLSLQSIITLFLQLISLHCLLCLFPSSFFTALGASCCNLLCTPDCQRLPLTLATTNPRHFTLTITSPSVSPLMSFSCVGSTTCDHFARPESVAASF